MAHLHTAKTAARLRTLLADMAWDPITTPQLNAALLDTLPRPLLELHIECLRHLYGKVGACRAGIAATAAGAGAV